MQKSLYNLENLPEIAREIIQKTQSKTLLFYADMGVGKTTLIKEIVKQLGSEDVVSSPTFSLVNQYLDSANKVIYHFDFYRIEDEVEALDIGIDEYFERDSWIFIEWPEKIKNFLPEDAQKIMLKRTRSGQNALEMTKLTQ